MLGGEVVVVGDGLIGLCCARALSRAGARVFIVGERLPGNASTAAAGLLAPTIEARSGAFQAFALEARDSYRVFVDELTASTGVEVSLRLDGILRVALDDTDVELWRGARTDGVAWVDAAQVRELEPALAPTLGGLLHARDGIVDNVALLSALDVDCRLRGLRRVTDHVHTVSAGADRGVVLDCRSGARIACETVVLAHGAWAASVVGLPRPLPVRPLRGQMLGYPTTGLTRPVYGAGGYVAVRPGRMTIGGGTSEETGFDAGTTRAARRSLEGIAGRLLPALRGREPHSHWSGLRPMTPDGMPILGRDPDAPWLVYACGHSRNGVLLAPRTGEVLADLILRGISPPVLDVLGPSRWA